MLKKSFITILCMFIMGIFAGGALAQTTKESISVQASTNVTPLASLGLNSPAKMKPNGEIVIYLAKGKKWQQVGSLRYDKYLRESKLDLSKFISGTKPVKLKLIQKGGGSAHLDAVILGTKLPLTVNGVKGMPLTKLSKRDDDLINLEKQGVELTFPAAGKNKTLTVAARVESVKISQTPFQFPLRNLYRKMDVNSEFYTYKLNSARETLKLGSMQKATSNQKTFYQERVSPESGHPTGIIYGWVSNDDQNLYVAQEFTPDNTMDGDKDYAKVYVRTDSGLKEFKVSVPETKWGKSSFIYTDKVAYQHKFYEFVIPLKELGLENGDLDKDVSIAFAGYGTMSAGEYYPSVAYDPVNQCYLVVYTFSNYMDGGIFGQFVSANGTQVGTPFTISPTGYYYYNSAVAYDSQNGRFLVAWQDQSYESNEIYGRFVDINGPSVQGEFIISDSYSAQRPALAYDNQQGRFLAVWEDYRTVEGQIYGRVVDANSISANPSSAYPSFAISNANGSYYKNNPTLVFDDSNNRFLVAWEDYSTAGYNIKYQLVDPLNPPAGDTLSVADSSADRFSPSVAYDSQLRQFLLTWTEQNVSQDVYGSLLNANGSPSGEIIVIAGDSTNQSKPAVAYDSVTGKYFVEWVGYDVNNQIYGQSVRADGVLDGASSVVSSRNLNYSVNRPGLVLNSQVPYFLTVYEATYTGVGYYSDIALDVIVTTGQAVVATKASLVFDTIRGGNSAASNIVSNLVLPTTGANGTVITWSTSNAAIVGNTGTVVRPAANQGDQTVTLTATITKEGASDSVNFTLIVKASDELTGAFTDLNLLAAIRTAISKSSGPITVTDLLNLTSLNAENTYISDLTGLEYAPNLRRLYLGNNQITDLSVLSNLTGLKQLYLNNNLISDLGPLAGLTDLKGLYLGGNSISDLTPLAGLTGLRELWLNHNQISELITIGSLTNLQVLGLQYNQITGITPLAELTKLQGVYLNHNQISELIPLSALSNLQGVYLSNNLISDLTPVVINSQNGGIGSGNYLDLRYNSDLDLTTGSTNGNSAQSLTNTGVIILK